MFCGGQFCAAAHHSNGVRHADPRDSPEPPSPPAPPPSDFTKLAEPAAARAAAASQGPSGAQPPRAPAPPNRARSARAANTSKSARSASAGASSATHAHTQISGSEATHSSSLESSRPHSHASSEVPLGPQRSGLRLADCAGGLVGGRGAVWPAGGRGGSSDAVKRRRSRLSSMDSQANGDADVDSASLLLSVALRTLFLLCLSL